MKLMKRPFACLSPYQTEHVNRFGRYTLKRDRARNSWTGFGYCGCLLDPKDSTSEKIKKSVTI